MIKYAIRLFENKVAAHLIFHATPDETRYSWQWYVTEDKNGEGDKIEGSNHESYITTTDFIKEDGFEELYLYCRFIDIHTKQEYTSEYVRLYSNLNKIIEEGTTFDDISQYNEKGDIV